MPVDIGKLKRYRAAIFDNSRWADFEPRPNDIFVCTPAKCGTTWTQTMCNHIDRMNEGVVDMFNARASSEGIPQLPSWNGDTHGYFPQWLEQGSHTHHIATFWPRRKQRNGLLVHYNDLKSDLPGR